MPPVMEERQEIDEVLEENKDIAHFSESSYVFTDISTSVCNRVRLMITEVLFLGDSSFFCFVYQTHCYFDIRIAIPVKCHDQPQLYVCLRVTILQKPGTYTRPQVFKRCITLSIGKISILWISVKETTTHWIKIYTVDSTIHLLNNWGQVSIL